jgi:hypothetical protein
MLTLNLSCVILAKIDTLLKYSLLMKPNEFIAIFLLLKTVPKVSKIEFECAPGFIGIYSLNDQKNSKAGNLLLVLVQNGNLLDAARTQAAYGIR